MRLLLLEPNTGGDENCEATDLGNEHIPMEYPGVVSQAIWNYAWSPNHKYDVPVITAMSTIHRACSIICSVDTYTARIASADYHFWPLAMGTPYNTEKLRGLLGCLMEALC